MRGGETLKGGYRGRILYQVDAEEAAQSLGGELAQALELAGVQTVASVSGSPPGLAVWVGHPDGAVPCEFSAHLWTVVIEPAGPEPRLYLKPPQASHGLAALADWLAVRSIDTASVDVDLRSLDDARWRDMLRDLFLALGAEQVWRLPGAIPWAARFRRRDLDGIDTTEVWVVFLVEREDGAQALREVLGPGQGTARTRLLERLSRRSEFIDSGDAICLLAVDHTGGDELPNWMAELRPYSDLRLRRWTARDVERLLLEQPGLLLRHFSPTAEHLRGLLAQAESRAADLEAANQALHRTEQERAWEQRQRMRAERDAVWKDLAARIAHKFGNPVATIGLIEDNLRDHVRPDDADGVECLDDLASCVLRLNNLLAEFKSYTRATGVEMEAMPLSCLLAALAADPMMRCGDVHLGEFVGDATVKVDLGKLLEVFEELFGNARALIKVAGKEPQIAVRCTRKDKPPKGSGLDVSRPYLVIAVEDNGPGIPDKDKEAIFLPFVTTRKEGSGQGLAIVRRIVDDHEGAVIENGLYGSGARFCIFLPIFGAKT